ncbi:MAG: hypothetical protein Metus_0476 [Candidatus Methanosuratincola subterraneus]|uniref:Uncharacterized protein n=1 Tax=Methanosuratincola subterraneus TaxID=2593994 RepID=A0A3S3S850_METS7|nr:MAG: hypothetical protein Metus_0476 [Candidatus Methanosuratincola subterraneus]
MGAGGGRGYPFGLKKKKGDGRKGPSLQPSAHLSDNPGLLCATEELVRKDRAPKRMINSPARLKIIKISKI